MAAAALPGILGRYSVFSLRSLENTESVKYVYLKFAIIQSVVFIFTEIHMQTEIPKNETYQTGFTFKAYPPPPPLGELRGWTEVKIQVFWNMDMLHIKLKKIAHASNMLHGVANDVNHRLSSP